MVTKQKLLQSIHQSRTQLIKALGELTDEQLTAIKDDQGWSVQDHIAHITAWEQSVQSVVEGKERYHGLGVDEATYFSGDFDKMNDRIFQQRQNLPLKTVLDQFHTVHNQFVEQIEAMTEAELLLPFRHYLSQGTKENDNRLLIELIQGNTVGHYAEHLAWIETFVSGNNP